MASTFRIMTWLGGSRWANEDGCSFTATPMVDVATGQLYLSCAADSQCDTLDDGTTFTVEQDEEVIRIDKVDGQTDRDPHDWLLPPSWHGHVVTPPADRLLPISRLPSRPKFRSIDAA